MLCVTDSYKDGIPQDVWSAPVAGLEGNWVTVRTDKQGARALVRPFIRAESGAAAGDPDHRLPTYDNLPGFLGPPATGGLVQGGSLFDEKETIARRLLEAAERRRPVEPPAPAQVVPEGLGGSAAAAGPLQEAAGDPLSAFAVAVSRPAPHPRYVNPAWRKSAHWSSPNSEGVSWDTNLLGAAARQRRSPAVVQPEVHSALTAEEAGFDWRDSSLLLGHGRRALAARGLAQPPASVGGPILHCHAGGRARVAQLRDRVLDHLARTPPGMAPGGYRRRRVHTLEDGVPSQ